MPLHEGEQTYRYMRSRVHGMVSKLWFQFPLVMAICGEKSMTIYHEIVHTLFLPLLVVTNSTEPGSNHVKALLMFDSFCMVSPFVI